MLFGGVMGYGISRILYDQLSSDRKCDSLASRPPMRRGMLTNCVGELRRRGKLLSGSSIVKLVVGWLNRSCFDGVMSEMKSVAWRWTGTCSG